MSRQHAQPFSAGPFLITPFIQPAHGGAFTASLSVRTGCGAQAHDRIYPFQSTFATRESALMYANVQGRYWLINPMSLA